ncbi:hypothetical protein ERHA54_35320 [Erwinia rhapontici]|uniref:hypothetical protein n=1 Tax=Erwinia rhapontici TaxID=55212 RepID=UPI001BB41377|nr:hypothetical protein [Erwinia rhapontici]BCQ40929.1 hypothetical protein ERHA54_35320 [Erwinia rhapontici]
MNNSNVTNKSSNENRGSSKFDIHQKLKASNYHLPYYLAAQPHQDDAKYELQTSLIGGVSFALYERVDNVFVLVDFFEDINEACVDAIAILNSWPCAKASILSWMEYEKN